MNCKLLGESVVLARAVCWGACCSHSTQFIRHNVAVRFPDDWLEVLRRILRLRLLFKVRDVFCNTHAVKSKSKQVFLRGKFRTCKLVIWLTLHFFLSYFWILSSWFWSFFNKTIRKELFRFWSFLLQELSSKILGLKKSPPLNAVLGNLTWN